MKKRFKAEPEKYHYAQKPKSLLFLFRKNAQGF